MKDTLNILSDNPVVGLISTLGSGMLHCLDIINPILSFISLCIAICIGIMTLYGKFKK